MFDYIIMAEWEPVDAEAIFIKDKVINEDNEIPVESEAKAIEKPPKKKRTLTDKQKEALAKGRAKAKLSREAKLKSHEELKKEQRTEMKEKKEQQLTQKEQRRLDTRKKVESRLLEDWEKKKYEALSSMKDMGSYNTMEAYLDTLSKEDILDKVKLKKRLNFMVTHLQNKIST